MASSIKGIILISCQKMEFADVQTNEIYHLDIPINVVRDMEVLNKEELAVYIKAFIDHYKIPSSDLVLMLADDIIYEKDIPPLVGTQYDEALGAYLEKIPFERVSNKIIHSDKGTKIISANQDLFLSIKESFEKHNFHVLGILPMRVVERNAMPKITLDPEIIRDIISGFDTFRQNYAITAEEPKKIKTASPMIEKEMKAPKSKREFILIGFLVLLIGIFIVMFYNYQKDQEKLKIKIRNKAVPTLVPARLPLPSLTPLILREEDSSTPSGFLPS